MKYPPLKNYSTRLLEIQVPEIRVSSTRISGNPKIGFRVPELRVLEFSIFFPYTTKICDNKGEIDERKVLLRYSDEKKNWK